MSDDTRIAILEAKIAELDATAATLRSQLESLLPQFREVEQESAHETPHLTPADIDAVIQNEQYFVLPGTTVTVAALTLTNGFVVVGKYAASAETSDREVGRKAAFEDARAQIWTLEGYLLRQRLHEGAASETT